MFLLIVVSIQIFLRVYKQEIVLETYLARELRSASFGFDVATSLVLNIFRAVNCIIYQMFVVPSPRNIYWSR